MVKFAWFILLLSSTSFPLHSQDAVDASLTELAWNEFYKLQWDDFQGSPDKNSLGDAGTAVQIRAKPYLVRKQVHYDVVAIFNRSKSWARDTSPTLLSHEQLHFDIAEVYARKIRKRVKELGDRGINDIKVYNTAIHELLEESNDIDRQYDLETLHGALSKKQQVWSVKIKNELANLRKFKKPVRVIGS